MLSKIKEVIDQEINPSLDLMTAKCEPLSFEKGILTLRMFGGCSGCPSSQLSLFNTVAPKLKERFPEIKDILLE